MKALAILLLCSTAALCEKKPEPVYQEAIFKSYRSVSMGSNCDSSGTTTGTVNASTDAMGNTNGTVNANTQTHGSCSDVTMAVYAVAIGSQIFTLTPTSTLVGSSVSFVTLGLSNAFKRDSVLYGQLPGTPIRIRSEGGVFYVKVGKRESMYKLIGVQ